MAGIIDFLSGKKTYLVAIIVGVEAALQYQGIIIPGWINTALAAIGLTTVRAAIDKNNP